MKKTNTLFIRAQILNPHHDHKCDYYEDGLLVIKNGKIFDLLPYKKGVDQYIKEISTSKIIDKKNSLLMPSFFDMHFHWVQDDVRLLPKDSLLEWLEKYTFPNEAKFKSKTFAKKKAQQFFKRLVSVGTLGGACYSSVHEQALHEAMKMAKGDLIIGNVLMTMNCPENLRQKPFEAVDLSIRMMNKYKHRYVLTPRFAIATHPEVMKQTSLIANKNKIFKQSHLSETKPEIEFVLSLFKRKFPNYKNIKTYTDIYHQVGMLGQNSLMGHAIHLNSHDIKLLKKTKTNLIHCPTSNAPIKERGIGSGLFNYRKINKHKIKWALGSDIGGGPFLSMFDVMKSFVQQQPKATFTMALYRATLAGAEILGLDHKTGNFKKGKDANFILVKSSPLSKSNPEDQLSKIMSNSREVMDFLVESTYYKGKKVF
jgi:guanine deaminase